MYIAKRLLALTLSLLILMMSAAQAESFLVHSKDWDLNNLPAEVLLKADVSTHMPFDDERLAMLTPITDRLSMRLVMGEDEGLVTIGISGKEALTLQYRGNSVQLSSMPEVTYVAEKDPISALLGGEASFDGVYESLHLSPDGESLLMDGRKLLAAFPQLFENGKKSKNTTNISGYGQSAYRLDYTFSAGKADEFRTGLLTACPEGWLREILNEMEFTGTQTVRMYFTAEDALLRMEYNGGCGPKGDIRTVKLVIRSRHDGEVDKDYVELTSPAKKGKNKNNLTFQRTVQTNKKGARVIEGSYKYTKTKDSVTSTWSGEFNLNNAFTDASDVIAGKMQFETKLNGAEKVSAVIIEPNLTIAGVADAPAIQGVLTITEQYAGRTTELAAVSIDMKRASGLVWTERPASIDLTGLDAQALAGVQQEVAMSVATALVRPLILELGQDAAWFFRDLPEDAVQSILDAAAK